MIVKSGEWPWPFTKMETSKSANGQIQKLAIHFEFGHSLILAIRWSGVLWPYDTLYDSSKVLLMEKLDSLGYY